jgi:D-arabinose 1-dehydrogenase-like Zn-dependent alcohol dehydrogenase
MKAAVIEGYKKNLVMHDSWPEPLCEAHGVVIKTKACGVCRSDWHGWQGHWDWIGFKPVLPAILGHEMVGEVVATGNRVTKFKRGDRVIAPFNLGCGSCTPCADGHQNVCDNFSAIGFHMSGGFGEYVHVPRADLNLVSLPDSLSYADGAALGCRYMTSYHGVVHEGEARPGEWVVVYGSGGVGLAAVEIAAEIGAQVIAVGRSAHKLELAKSLGACEALRFHDKVADEIAEITKGGAHLSLDCLGIRDTCVQSVLSLRKRGRHVQLGLTSEEEKGQVSLPIDLMVAKELTLRGSLGMQPHRYGEMLAQVVRGRLNPGRMISRQIKPEEIGNTLQLMTDYKTDGFVIVNWV